MRQIQSQALQMIVEPIGSKRGPQVEERDQLEPKVTIGAHECVHDLRRDRHFPLFIRHDILKCGCGEFDDDRVDMTQFT